MLAGGRTAEEIANWMKKKTGPPAKTLASVEETTEFVENKPADGFVVVGFFEDADSDEAKVC